MIWLLWRQHRVQAALAACLVALFAVPVGITGVQLTDAFTSCRSAGGGCSGDSLFRNYGAMVTIVDITLLVPLLIGVFWGATIVGRELDSGTATLVWTQSVTRRQWLRTKVLTLFVMATVCSAAVSGLVTWWSNTHNATAESRFVGLQFDIQGVAPVGYALFAASLGLAAGVLWRRLLPAMATTVGGFIAVRLLVELALRPHYLAPVVRSAAMSSVGGDGAPPGSWVSGSDLTLNGHVVTGPINNTCVGANTRSSIDACLDRLGYRFQTTYQPAGRYWTFQWIEFGIFVGLAAILLAAAVIALRRHDA
jgi:hypothetical protein